MSQGLACLATVPCFVAFYYLVAPRYTTLKQRAWVLTTLSSLLTSVAALPYFYDFISSGGRVQALRASSAWSDTVVRVFQGYLVSDLLLGALCYPKYVNISTGWVHHTLYFILIHYITSMGWSNIFCLGLIMEVPTLILALGSLHPRLRSDNLFASTFFAFRIVFHIILILAYAATYRNSRFSQPARLSLNSNATCIPPNHPFSELCHTTSVNPLLDFHSPFTSPLPAIFFFSAFPLHCMWFTACIQGILRRRAHNINAQNIKERTPLLLVSAVRTRIGVMQGRLRLAHEDRERLRARLGAAYGSARERVWRREVWARRMERFYGALNA
ncbi:hypothetical protein BDV93DRAFT_547167 [Ceratobasidium sp. AG-I]|nr:hypothetical protein BDV93DRAFT_547167 [Ceratobasidium sp. AG-I]